MRLDSRWMPVRGDLDVAVQDALCEAHIEVSWTQPQTVGGPTSAER